MSALDALAVLVIALVPVNWAIAGFLVRLSRAHRDATTLAERASLQVLLAIAATIGGVFGAIELTHAPVGGGTVTVLLAILVLLASVPGLRWLVLYLKDGFQ